MKDPNKRELVIRRLIRQVENDFVLLKKSLDDRNYRACESLGISLFGGVNKLRKEANALHEIEWLNRILKKKVVK